MQRRNLLIGMGSIAAGGAATIGTGAVTTTNSQRGFSAKVVGEGAANLGVTANTSSDLVEKNSPLSISLTGDENGDGGLSQDSITTIRPAFSLQNNVTNPLYVEITNPLRNNNIANKDEVKHPGLPGNNKHEVPAGIDVQFVATGPDATTGDTSNGQAGTVSIIDRSEAPAIANFQERLDPSRFYTDITARGVVGGKSVSFNDSMAGYIKLSPGASVDIVLRAIVSGYSGPMDKDLTDGAPFNIRAFTDSSLMDLGQKAAEYGTASN